MNKLHAFLLLVKVILLQEPVGC